MQFYSLCSSTPTEPSRCVSLSCQMLLLLSISVFTDFTRSKSARKKKVLGPFPDVIPGRTGASCYRCRILGLGRPGDASCWPRASIFLLSLTAPLYLTCPLHLPLMRSTPLVSNATCPAHSCPCLVVPTPLLFHLPSLMIHYA
jgi:hypothetical protein